MTVQELREALADLPGDAPVRFYTNEWNSFGEPKVHAIHAVGVSQDKDWVWLEELH